MAIPEDHLAKFHKMIDAKEMWEAIKSRFRGNDESKKMRKYLLKQQFKSVSTKDANQKFIRSLPSSWSQVSLIMRTKPRVDTLNFDDLYNNLRVFESDVQDSTGSSSSTQNMAFVSSDNTSSTNEVNTTHGVFTSSGHTHKGKALHHTLMISCTPSLLINLVVHNWIMKILNRDAGNTRYKVRDNGKKPAKQDKHKAMVTIHGEGVDWTGHAEDETEDFALMAFNSSNLGSDTEKLLAEAEKEKEELKTKLENFQSSSKGLSKLQNSQMSAKDKSGLGYGSQIHDGVLSYENEVFASVFDSRSSDVEDSHVNDRFAKVERMHAVPPPMTGNYMPLKSDFGIDDFSEETLKTVPKPIESKPKVVNEPKVWIDALIIEKYESDSDDEHVTIPLKEQEKPSFAFVNTVVHVTPPRQTAKEQNTFLAISLEIVISMRKEWLNSKGQITSKGTQDSFDARNYEMEADHAQEYYILPLWSSNTSTVKISKAKNGDEKLNEDTETLRKTFAHSIEDLLLQAGTARASSANYVNTASSPVNAASTPLKSAGTPTNQDDSQIPSLEDICEVLRDGIFTSASYDDEGAVANFKNLETSMNEELLQFKIQKVWILVDLPFGKKATRTKWVYRNKKDERGVVVRNKARLVAQGYRQEEGIDYDEVFALVARIEAMRIFLAFVTYMGFIVYQMDVKSAFLYEKIDEQVAWYDALSTFLVQSGYRRGLIDKTLFIKKDKKNIMLVQVYVDDIIFGSIKKSWCDEFETLMKNSQDKYVAEILKKFDFLSVKTVSTPIETKKPLFKDEEAVDVDVHLYRSIIGSLMYLNASRLDIMYAVCACSRFQVTPKTSHLQAVKRIF
nr:putative ribonuclease H-like domain-containing protein [Tanacetum cinerariifolium]